MLFHQQTIGLEASNATFGGFKHIVWRPQTVRLALLYQIIFGIFVVISLVEDAGDALQLVASMVYKTLPNRLFAKCAIACHGTNPAIIEKCDPAKLLQ